MCSPNPSKRGNPSQAMKNLLKPMPAGRKMRLYMRNMLARISKRQMCCGHPGEPGC
jgi:hypothetical protein